MTRTLVLAIAIAAGGTMGCSQAPAIPPDQIDDELAEVGCEAAFRCCDMAEIDVIFGGTVSTEAECEVSYGNLLRALLGFVEPGIAAGRASWNAQSAGDCVAYLRGRPCSDINMVLPSSTGFTYPACNAMITPLTGPGDACANDLECTTGFCNGGGTTASGTCANEPGNGETCTGRCTDGHYCEAGLAGGAVCRPLLENGMPCTSGVACRSGNCESSFCAAAMTVMRCDGT
jgi:hypothetical protein